MSALIREMREELGVLIDAPNKGPEAVISDEDAGLELSVWVIDRWQGDVINAAPREHDEIRWFTGSDLLSVKLAHPRLLGVLQTALDGNTTSKATSTA